MRRAELLFLCTLLLPIAGCRHRVATPLAVLPVAPDIAPVMVSVPPPTHPTEPLPTAALPVVPTPAPVATAPRKVRRRKPVQTPPVQVAVVTPPPAPPPSIALGQLSAGGEAGSGSRSETESLLAAQKLRLERLPPSVAAGHAADVEQAQRFLKSAEDAWKIADMEGAHTLVLKAKVLLDDLSK